MNDRSMSSDTQCLIDKRGFVLEKSNYDPAFLNIHRKALTVTPRMNPDYVIKPVSSYQIFGEDSEFMYLPRFYGKGLKLPYVERFFDKPRLSRLNSTITLRDYQKPVIEAALRALKNNGGGFLACGTGTGKTSMALHLACCLGVKTLVIVHKSFLLQQWKSRIEDFVPHAKIGIIQGPTIDIENKDIVLAMLQSLASKTYSENVFSDIGLVIADEAHHLSAEVFCRALPKVASKYMLGLSATPTRKDGLTKVFKWYLGDIAYTLDRSDTDSVCVKRIIFSCSAENYGREKKNYRGNILLPSMITDITLCESRNALIIETIQFYIKEDRQIMIISDRIAHLEHLKGLFDSKSMRLERINNQLVTSGFYTGRQKQKDLDINESKNVIFSSYGLVREGLDIQSLNTIIFATPVSDVVQACGRILRKTHVCNPLIIDIVDQFSIFYAQGNKRNAFYNKSGYNVFKQYYNPDIHDKDLLSLSTEDMRSDIDSRKVIVDDLPKKDCTKDEAPVLFLESDDD